MKNKLPWCIDPFINFAHTADGYYRPCCIGTVDRDNGSNVSNMSPIEYFTGDEMDKVRRDMLSRNFSEHTKFLCSQCFKNDKDGVKSRRIKQNETYFEYDEIHQLIDKYQDPNYKARVEDLKYVNFKILGNLCNLKCLMCGPSASSKIAAEWKKHNIAGHGNLKNVERLPYNDITKQSYMTDFDKILENIDRFSLVGGEAFINPNFDEIWNILSNNKNAKNMDLLIITNGTILPQKVLDNAGNFKKLLLLFSIDGVYERGSYVRSGLDWNKFDSNVKRALDSDAECSFTVATSMLNIGYLDDIYNYLKTLNVSDYQIQWDAVVTDPAYLRASNLPAHIKKQYFEKLYNHPAFTQNNAKFNSALEILQSTNDNHQSFLDGIKFLKKIDSIRKTNTLKFFPEFAEYYEKLNTKKENTQ